MPMTLFFIQHEYPYRAAVCLRAERTPLSRRKKRTGSAQDKVGVASPEKIRMNTTATSEARSETSEAA